MKVNGVMVWVKCVLVMVNGVMVWGKVCDFEGKWSDSGKVSDS